MIQLENCSINEVYLSILMIGGLIVAYFAEEFDSNSFESDKVYLYSVVFSLTTKKTKNLGSPYNVVFNQNSKNKWPIILLVVFIKILVNKVVSLTKEIYFKLQSFAALYPLWFQLTATMLVQSGRMCYSFLFVETIFIVQNAAVVEFGLVQLLKAMGKQEIIPQLARLQDKLYSDRACSVYQHIAWNDERFSNAQGALNQAFTDKILPKPKEFTPLPGTKGYIYPWHSETDKPSKLLFDPETHRRIKVPSYIHAKGSYSQWLADRTTERKWTLPQKW